MAELSDYDLAKERAQKRMSEPKVEPTQAGIIGMVVATGPVGIFLSLNGMDSDAFGGSIAAMAVLGFGIPYLYFRHEHSKFLRILAEESARVRESRDVKRR